MQTQLDIFAYHLLHFMTGEDVPVRYIQPSKDEAGNYLSWESVKKLRVSHDENPIVLQQIEIYGVDGINYALAKNGGSAEQSSVHYTGMDYGRASCVIDGNRAGYKSETAHVPNGWLEVILSEARCIESFAIFNSEFDSCLRANRQLIQLFDEKDQLVYEHRISISEDLPLFDPHHCCSLRFINQDSKVVMLNLTMEISEEADTVTWKIWKTHIFFVFGGFIWRHLLRTLHFAAILELLFPIRPQQIPPRSTFLPMV